MPRTERFEFRVTIEKKELIFAAKGDASASAFVEAAVDMRLGLRPFVPVGGASAAPAATEPTPRPQPPQPDTSAPSGRGLAQVIPLHGERPVRNPDPPDPPAKPSRKRKAPPEPPEEAPVEAPERGDEPAPSQQLVLEEADLAAAVEHSFLRRPPPRRTGGRRHR